jgi:hypothetical protein
MLGYTLKEYKENYFINLNAYLEEYEDNSKSEFLEKELSKIQLYSTALHRISRAIIGYDRPKNATIRSGKELLLKQQNFKVYVDIVSNIDLVEGDNFGQQLELSLINIDCVKLANYIKSTRLILQFINDESKHDNSSALLNTNSSNFIQKGNSDVDSFATTLADEDKFTGKIWFKVGLFFANGKAQELYKRYKSEKGHFSKITLELGFKSTDRPYFSETINNTTTDPKNIFKDVKKMTIIHKYCLENSIPLSIDFISVFNDLQMKQN